MTLSTDQRTALVAKLARQVTLKDGVMYPELETALTALIDGISADQAPSDAVDWPAIVSEGTNLRPQH